jgi:ribosomal protein S18 acetylase RimI-like enzyme
MTTTPAPIAVRPLTPADRPRHDALLHALDAAHHAAVPDLIRAPGDATVSADEYQRRLRDPATFLAGAETASGLVGFIRVSLIDNPGGRAHRPHRSARIEEIVVEVGARRAGVGRALLSAARDWARTQGAQSLDLGVYTFNTEALAFYQREGFATRTIGLSLPLGPSR